MIAASSEVKGRPDRSPTAAPHAIELNFPPTDVGWPRRRLVARRASFHPRTRKNHGRIDAVLLYYPATENPFLRWGAQDAASDAVVRDLTVTYRDVRVPR